MSGRGKRLWAPRLDFSQAYRDVLAFLKNCQAHNLVGSSGGSPVLFHAYLAEGLWPTEGFIDASSVLKFGFDRNPIADQAKQALARLLAVAVKAHFFLAPQAVVVHEPYLFVMPDVSNPGQRRYGLMYPLEHGGRMATVVVAEWDLAMVSSRHTKLPVGHKFPVVLPADPMQWVPLKHWRALKDEAGEQGWFDAGTGRARSQWLASVRAHTDLTSFGDRYGHVLNYGKELNDDVRAVGALWAPGVRRWFLPKGWDVKPVTDYLDRLAAMAPSERYALRWWEQLTYPRDAERAS